MYIHVLQYYPNQANPMHASGRGVWRVMLTVKARGRPCNPLTMWPSVLKGRAALSLRSGVAVKPRSRVNPRHLLGV
jgi:hypothetical protein